MLNSQSLTGQLAIVTGASSGIGKAIALSLASQGCKVLATGRNKERLYALSSEAPEGSVIAVELDMRDSNGILEINNHLPVGYESIDILINNAAEDIGGRTRFDLASADEVCRVIETNLIGLMRITHALVPGMLKKGRGTIVNIGSTNSQRPTPTMAAYTASKAGVHAFSDVLRADYAKEGIRIIEIVPGLTRTDFAKNRMRGDTEKANAFFEKFPGSLDPTDVADAVMYAVSRPQHVCIQQIVVTPWFQW